MTHPAISHGLLGSIGQTPLIRLARASAQLARQREALSRATAALDRAIDVLMPGAAAPVSRVYNANGLSTPLRSSTNLNA
jgi:hypothetical protein